jgi:predicted transcriptional regulator of viral defense system
LSRLVEKILKIHLAPGIADWFSFKIFRRAIYFLANFAYNISKKGSGCMTQYERLDQLFTQHNGIVKTSQALEAGVPKPTLYAYVRECGMEQAGHGIFVSPDSWTDGMYLLHLRCDQAVFSHETALFFHDLTDREPTQYSITVKTGYNPSYLKADGIQVYTIKKELHDVGVTTVQTTFGHPVPVYNMERTICDLIRSRSSVEAQTLQDALKQYAQRRDKNLRLLMQYAALFRVEKILRQYLEVLL